MSESFFYYYYFLWQAGKKGVLPSSVQSKKISRKVFGQHYLWNAPTYHKHSQLEVNQQNNVCPYNHGHPPCWCNYSHGSFDYYQSPHDPNLTMTILLYVLVQWVSDNLLPPVLYLQFDNCVRENKNRLMFAVLALLIEENTFQKVLLLTQ